MKKKSTKLIILTAVLCFSLLAFTGCGNKNKNENTTITPETSIIIETTKTAEPSAGMAGENRNYGSYYVYYANPERDGLLKDTFEYTKDYAKDLSGRVRESLMNLFDKSGDDYMPLSDKESNIKSITLDKNNVLVIEFEKSLGDSIKDIDLPDNVTLYGLINTLAQYSEIKEVKFTVEGKPLIIKDKSYDMPVKANHDLMKEKAK